MLIAVKKNKSVVVSAIVTDPDPHQSDISEYGLHHSRE